MNFGSSSGRDIESPSPLFLLWLSQTTRRLGEIKPGPVFGKVSIHNQVGSFSGKNRCLQFGFQVLRTRRGCQRDLLNGDSPCSETFILIAGLFFQLTISDVPGV